ncbi:MAG TPA: hypothetical protein VEA38_23080 [Terriglobales bacterium]|nr:hypothetical protein [Terriglobales bacterium]
MRRRLGGGTAVAAPPQNTAPLTTTATPVQQPTQAPALPTQAIPQGTALALPPDLAALGAFERPEHLAPAQGGYAPYLRFYTGKGKSAAEIIGALGQVPVGTQVLAWDGHYYNLTGTGLLIIQELPYWAATDDSYAELGAWLTPQPRGKEFKGRRVGEVVLTVVLHLPGVAPLPPDLAPAICSVTQFRSATTKVPRSHLDAVEKTLSPEWAREGANGAIIGAGVQPRYRVVSQVTANGRTSKKGDAYVEAEAHTQPISMAQIQAFSQWSQDPESVEQLRQCLDEFDRKAEAIRDLAEETAAAKG